MYVIGLAFVNEYGGLLDIVLDWVLGGAEILSFPRMDTVRSKLWDSWKHQTYGGRRCERFASGLIPSVEIE